MLKTIENPWFLRFLIEFGFGFDPSGEPLGSLLEASGASWVPSGCLLALSWVSSRGTLGSVLDGLGLSLFAALRVPLGDSWAALGRPGAILGSSWLLLGHSWLLLGGP